MMAAVGARHIAQQVGFGADTVQIDRHRVVHRRVTLQHEPDGPAEPDRGLRRNDRALLPKVIGSTVPGNSTRLRVVIRISASSGIAARLDRHGARSRRGLRRRCAASAIRNVCS